MAVKERKLSPNQIPKIERGTTIVDLDGTSYQIGDVLGEGGLGQVYLATNSEGKFAIKIPHFFQHCPDLIIESRWTLRAEIPHAVTVIALGQHIFTGIPEQVVTVVRNRPIPFLVMPRMQMTLNKYLKKNMTVPVGQAVRWIIQLSTACQALGIVHRDLKPENIFLDKQGNAFLGDFGLAIPASAQERERACVTLSSRAAGAGTPDYQAPEQMANATDLAPSTDIFALGMILFEMLTCRPARAVPTDILGNDHRKMIDWCSQHGFAPRKANFTLKEPQGLWPVLERCFEIGRGKRYAHHQDLIRDLTPFATPPT